MNDHTKRNFLWVIDALTVGGVERVVSDLTSIQVERFPEQTIYLAVDRRLANEIEIHKKVVIVTMPRAKSVWDIKGCLLFSKRLGKFTKKFDITDIISHSSGVNLMCLLAKAYGFIANSCRLTVVEHNNIKKTRLGRNYWKATLFSLLYVAYAHRIIAVSRGIEMQMRDSSLFFSKTRKLFTIQNPIDRERIRRLSAGQTASSWGPKKLKLVAVGRLVRQKNFASLLSICKILSNQVDFHLVIVGGGPDEEMLKALAAKLDIQNTVSFTGSIANPYKYICTADMLLCTSSWEAYGLVLAESLILHTPVVTFDFEHGAREIILHPHHGKIISLGDSAAFAKAIIEQFRELQRPNIKECELSHISTPLQTLKLYLEAI